MWLPGFDRWDIPGKAGVAYDEYDDPKAMVHTTEGTSIEGAVATYAPYPPHLVVDPWRKRKVQHIDLERAAYALWNGDVDDSRCIQIEIVGYAKDTPSWPDEVYQWLGEEVARPLHEHFGVPYIEVWKGFKAPADVNFILASASSPLRLTQHEIDTFSGWLAHQHVPGDDHWDAGGFKCGLMLAYAQETDMITPNDGNVRFRAAHPEDPTHVEEHPWANWIGFSAYRGADSVALLREAKIIQAEILNAVTADDFDAQEALARMEKGAREGAQQAVTTVVVPVLRDAVREVFGEDNEALVQAFLDGLGQRLTPSA